MPRMRNLFDYSTEDTVHRPHETLIDVPKTDSVRVITIHFEDNGFVQIRKDEEGEWLVVTSIDEVRHVKASSGYLR